MLSLGKFCNSRSSGPRFWEHFGGRQFRGALETVQKRRVCFQPAPQQPVAVQKEHREGRGATEDALGAALRWTRGCCRREGSGTARSLRGWGRPSRPGQPGPPRATEAPVLRSPERPGSARARLGRGEGALPAGARAAASRSEGEWAPGGGGGGDARPGRPLALACRPRGPRPGRPRAAVTVARARPVGRG